jgi:long-chain acyl-CoA synthetase
LPNDIDIVIVFYGVMRLGAVWVGVNQVLAAVEKSWIVSDSGADVLLCDAKTASEMEPLLRGAAHTVRVLIVSSTDREWRERLQSPGPDVDPPPVNPRSPAVIAYTSGTSGQPKGVLLSQANLLLPGAMLIQSRGYDATLHKGDFIALTIANVMVLGPLLTLQAGGRFVAMDLHTQTASEWIRREKITVWNGVPAMLFDMAHGSETSPESLATLSEVWTGGSPCSESLYSAFGERFGIELTSTYGLTEAPSIVAIQPRNRARTPGASGVPLSHLEVASLDDEGNRVAPGDDGELCIRATRSGRWAGLYETMIGYWNNPEATEQALEGGWLHTGDIGHVTGSGELFVVDRKKNLIIRGGANIYPAEVERVINTLDGVAESVVLGLPDERLGERVVAVAIRAPGGSVTEEEIRDACARNLAKYKVPEQVTFASEFPRNAMGKVQREAVLSLHFSE